MTSVTLHRDPDSNITTATGTGRVTASDLWAALDKFYDDSPTLLALCDLSQADLSSLSGQELSRLSSSRKAGRLSGAGVGLLLWHLKISSTGWHECTRVSPRSTGTQ
jgi:hypothetical protein